MNVYKLMSGVARSLGDHSTLIPFFLNHLSLTHIIAYTLSLHVYFFNYSGGKGVIKTKKKVQKFKCNHVCFLACNTRIHPFRVCNIINLILPSAECRTEKDYCLIVSKKQEKICHCRNRAENIWYVCIESFAT